MFTKKFGLVSLSALCFKLWGLAFLSIGLHAGSRIADAQTRLLLHSGEPEFVQHTKLLASDREFLDHYGSGVATDGETVFVGAYADDDIHDNAGAVYVYSYNGLTWDEAKIYPTRLAPEQHFGESVDVDGERLIVGAPGINSAKGDVFVFQYNPDTENWEPDGKLPTDNVPLGSEFGMFMALSGDVVAVGIVDMNQDTGAVFMFRYNAGSGLWDEEQIVTASDGEQYDRFGGTVDVHENLLIVGATGRDDGAPVAGAAYVYQFNAGLGIWEEQQKLLASDPDPSDEFGRSVIIRDDVAFISGSERSDFSGSVYVFEHGTEWVETQKLEPLDLEPLDHLGSFMSLDGDRVLISAHGDDDNGNYSGTAYLFVHDGSSWVEDQKLLALDPWAGESMGVNVALAGDVVVMGATNYAEDINTGAAYVFQGCEGGCVCGDGSVNQPGEVCDDGEDNGRQGFCNLQCTGPFLGGRVFVTSQSWDGNLGGLDGADAKCQTAAATADLGGVWQAWLSDDAASAADRLQHQEGEYLLVDGTVVADDWDDLITCDGPDIECLQQAINMDEFGQSREVVVWTGTNPDGSADSFNCNDWLDDASSPWGRTGFSNQTLRTWTDSNAKHCNEPQHLYCFEHPASALPGDINGDGVVDFADVLEVLSDWGCQGDCTADVNGDGIVDFSDILFILARWS